MLLAAAKGFQHFPTRIVLLAHTYFSDGSQLTTSNGGKYGGKPLFPGNVHHRARHAEAPAELLACHRRALDQLLVEGRRAAPEMDLEALLEHKVEEFKRVRREKARRGYFSWIAAVRQAYQLERQEETASE